VARGHHSSSMNVASLHVLKRMDKLFPDQFEKVTHPKLKLPLTNQRALFLTWPANGRWTFKIFGKERSHETF
jgi:hypothetical protein